MTEKTNRTTLGDRLSTGAVNGAFAGGVVSATLLAYNGAAKLISKAGIRFSKGQWIAAGAATAIGSLVGFFTASREKENNREAYLNGAIDIANDTSNGLTKEQREQKVTEAFNDVLVGKVDNVPAPESTKHRDHVAAERSATPEAVATQAR